MRNSEMRVRLPAVRPLRLLALAAFLLTAGAARASVIADVAGFIDASVPVPAGARGVVRFFPGGGMGTLGVNGWLPADVNLGFVASGLLEITVTDLGPATCNGLVCTPNGAVYPGNTFLQGDIFEAILNQQSLGYTEPLTPNGAPTTPIAFVANLNSFTFTQVVKAGNYTLYFDDLTIAYLGGNPPVQWPEASVYVVNGVNAVPPDFLTDAFQVTVTYSPEPSTLALLGLGLTLTLALARRRGIA